MDALTLLQEMEAACPVGCTVSIIKDDGNALLLNWRFRIRSRSIGWNTRVRRQDMPDIKSILEHVGLNIRATIKGATK